MWTWNAAQQSRIRAVEISYIRGSCGVSGWDGDCNERFGMGVTVQVDCGVVEWVKGGVLRWFGHVDENGGE